MQSNTVRHIPLFKDGAWFGKLSVLKPTVCSMEAHVHRDGRPQNSMNEGTAFLGWRMQADDVASWVWILLWSCVWCRSHCSCVGLDIDAQPADLKELFLHTEFSTTAQGLGQKVMPIRQIIIKKTFSESSVTPCTQTGRIGFILCGKSFQTGFFHSFIPIIFTSWHFDPEISQLVQSSENIRSTIC